MYEAGIPILIAKHHFAGCNINWLQAVASGFTSRTFFKSTGFGFCLCRRLEDRIKTCLEGSLELLDKFKLKDICGRRVKDQEDKQSDSLVSRVAWRNNAVESFQ